MVTDGLREKLNDRRGAVWALALSLAIAAPNIISFWRIPGPMQLARVVFVAALVIVPIVIFKLRPRIYLILLLPLLLLEYPDFVHMLQYGKHLTVGAVASVFYSDSKEATEFLWHTSSITLPTSLGITIAIILLFIMAPKNPPTFKPRYRVGLIAGVLAIPQFYDITGTFPLYTAKQVYRFYEMNSEFKTQVAQRRSLKYEVKKNNSDKDGLFVLVVGESAYRRHLGVYGYERNTTPNLSKRSDLILFDDVSAPANLTQNSVPLLLTPATASEPGLFYKYPSIVSLAKAAGFDTYWLSNQSKMNSSDNEVSVLAEEADFRKFRDTGLSSSLDGKLISDLEQALQHGGGKKFIVLHLLGSHVEYIERYPQEFNKFTDRPSLARVDDPKVFQMINSYDNSVAYTDYVLDQVITKVDKQEKPACVVYISDHGEYLSSFTTKSGHGYPTAIRPEAEIPLIVYCSNKYRRLHQETIKSMIGNRDLPVVGEDLFFAMADLLGIEFPIMDKKHSFFNAEYLPPHVRWIMNGQEKLNDVEHLKSEPDFQ